jgi:hypothetical protein
MFTVRLFLRRVCRGSGMSIHTAMNRRRIRRGGWIYSWTNAALSWSVSDVGIMGYCILH